MVRAIVVGFLLWPALAAAQCRLVAETPAVERAGDCTLTTHRGRVVDEATDRAYELSETLVACGQLKLGDWPARVRRALEACRTEMKPTQTFEDHGTRALVSRWKQLVSIDTISRGYTGGAHPFETVQRRTYNTRTGDAVTLEACFPEQHAEVVRETNRRFARADRGEGRYHYDPDAFAVAVTPTATTLRFLFHHGIEVFQGQTLKLKAVVRGTPECGGSTR